MDILQKTRIGGKLKYRKCCQFCGIEYWAGNFDTMYCGRNCVASAKRERRRNTPVQVVQNEFDIEQTLKDVGAGYRQNQLPKVLAELKRYGYELKKSVTNL